MMINGAVASAAAYGSGAFLQVRPLPLFQSTGWQELVHKFTSLNVVA